MKITRNQLRQLINEALKPFFMGIAPSNEIQMLINDPKITNQQFKQLLGYQDPDTQRMAMELFFSDITGFLNMDETSAFSHLKQNYPNLYAQYQSHIKGIPQNFDPIDKENPGYKKHFGMSQQRAKDIEKRMPIIQDDYDAELKIAELLKPYQSQLTDLHVYAGRDWEGYSAKIYTINLPILKQIYEDAKSMRINTDHGISNWWLNKSIESHPERSGKYELSISI